MVTDDDRTIRQVEVERDIGGHDLWWVSSNLRAGLTGAHEGGVYRGALSATGHGHITGFRTERLGRHIQDHW